MYAACDRAVMSEQPSPSRLEAFSDGVIAVIITIMVLEFKVPREPGLGGLATILPTLIVYLLSFIFTGIYWINHHHLVDKLKQVDVLILWANLGLLFSLSLMPFFTNYMIEKHLDSFSIALYALSLLTSGFAFSLLQKAIIRNLRRTAPVCDQVKRHESHSEMRKGYLSVAMYVVAVPLAFWHPYVALLVIASVTVIWIIPTFGLKPAKVHELEPQD